MVLLIEGRFIMIYFVFYELQIKITWWGILQSCLLCIYILIHKFKCRSQSFGLFLHLNIKLYERKN